MPDQKRSLQELLREWLDTAKAGCLVLKMRPVQGGDGRYEQFDCGDCLACRTRVALGQELDR